MFRYQNEVINTGIDFIDNPDGGGSDGDGTGDDITNRPQYSVTQTLQLVGVGQTATAVTTIVNGGVRFITVTNRGNGYTSSPQVAFSTSPGVTATGIATMIDAIVTGKLSDKTSASFIKLGTTSSAYASLLFSKPG